MMPNQSTILRRLCCLHARMLLAVLPLQLLAYYAALTRSA